MVVQLQAGDLLVGGLHLLLPDGGWHGVLIKPVADEILLRPEDWPGSGLAPALPQSVIEVGREGRQRLELSEARHWSEGSLVQHHSAFEDDELRAASADEVLVDADVTLGELLLAAQSLGELRVPDNDVSVGSYTDTSLLREDIEEFGRAG